MWTAFLTNFAAPGCGKSFFGIKPWYQYLNTDASCNVINFQILYERVPYSDITLVALALVDALLRIAGFVAIGYIIYGGFLYITSQGSPDQTGKAQNAIQNALIGLVIAIVAIALVTFVGNRLG